MRPLIGAYGVWVMLVETVFAAPSVGEIKRPWWTAMRGLIGTRSRA